ncbi:hypothetical protein DO233_23330 [Salmonella enterica]|nr:hypothetical protein [Salmonella enterica]
MSSIAAFLILPLSPALNAFPYRRIFTAICLIPENNSAIFPLLIRQSSSFMATSKDFCKRFSIRQCSLTYEANFFAVNLLGLYNSVFALYALSSEPLFPLEKTRQHIISLTISTQR